MAIKGLGVSNRLYDEQIFGAGNTDNPYQENVILSVVFIA